MFRFENINALYLLLLIPLLIVLYIIIKKGHKRRLERFGELEVIQPLMGESAWHKVRIKFILYSSIIALLTLAIARPQLGSKLREVKVSGAEIMVAVDVSNSMLAEDITPSRLERTKFALTSLASNLAEDRLGLIVFAADAFVQLPITSDGVSAKNFIEYISPGMVEAQGTNISKALALASRSFSGQSDKSRAIILISDGEDHEQGAAELAKKIGESGVQIHVIGIGSVNGAPITIDGNTLKDSEGNMVVSKLNEQMLSEIALASNGSYIRASNGSLGLSKIINEIRKLEKEEFSSMTFEEYDEQFPYFLIIAIALLLLEFLILERRNKFRIKIFSTAGDSSQK